MKLSRYWKLNIAAAVIVLIILVCSFFAVIIASVTTIDAVSGFSAGESGAYSQALKWMPVRNADGYKLYAYFPEYKGYCEIMNIAGGEKKSVTVPNLAQAHEYKYYITAYKTTAGKLIESKKSKTVEAFTQPEKASLESLISINANQAIMFWYQNPASGGYELQYSPDPQFKTFSKLEYNDSAMVNATVDGLTAGTDYFFRVRSKIDANGKIVYGTWSDAGTVRISDVTKPVIDPAKPMVALTFDDGPDYGSSSDKILNVLEKYHARATFFMVGEKCKKQSR